MLYDPKWEIKTDENGLPAIHDFIAWLEKQPSNKEYDSTDASGCMLADYLGRDAPRDIPDGPWVDIIFPRLDPQTYGAALKRARAVAARG